MKLRESMKKQREISATWKSQFRLFQARSVSLVTFVIIISHNGLPQRLLPLCLTVKLKCLCSEPCPPVDDRKEEINISICLRLAILEDTCRIKKNLAARPWQDGYFETLVCLLSELASQIKSNSLPQCLVPWIHWPLVLQAEWAWTQ